MKKIIFLGLPAIIALSLIVFGRDLCDLYRLQQFIDRTSEAYKANGGAWPQLADVCTGCHGTDGNSQHQRYPSLAGQPALYVENQLRNFASGQRSNPNMGPLAMTLSDAEIKLLADYFARQSVAENRSFEPDSGLREKGKELVAKGGCMGCHGEHLMGHDQFPRLAGQGYDYLVTQLAAFAGGARTESSGVMNDLTAMVSPEDRKAMANYLASLPTQNADLPRNRKE